MALPAQAQGARSVTPGGDETVVRLGLDELQWREFVSTQPHATAFHQPEWGTFLAEYYGFDAFAIALADNGRLTAGVPILECRRPFGRPRWISLPFTDECEVLGADSEGRFFGAFDRARREAGIASFEIRAAVAGGHHRSRGITHRLALAADVDAVMGGYRSSIRQGIRVASREGVVVHRAEGRADLTHTFYALHVATRRRLGVPVQSRRYFALLWDRLIAPGHGFVLIAERQGVPLAAAVFLHANGGVLYKYGASDAEHWKLRANTALFHSAIAWSAEAGFRVFDWGRTDLEDEGLRRFKSSWGAAESDLVYTTIGAPSTESQTGRLNALARLVIRHSPSSVCRLAGSLYRYAA